MLSYGKQSISKKDIAEVVKVLKSDWIAQGPRIDDFEKALARYCGSKYAVAVSSGTAGLHLAALAAGFGAKDEVITSPNTFMATANSIVYAGAKPVFADIDKDGNIDPQSIEKKITKKTKAIIPVHFAGTPCDMSAIIRIARKHKLLVIEDGAHSLGARYKSNGKWVKIGSCKHSEMTVFSFHPVKHITTGEGGAITTNSKKHYEMLKELRNHGIHKNAQLTRKGPWLHEMRNLGFNYRITDLQCALGLSQLKQLNGFIRKRRDILGKYTKAFKGLKTVEILKESNGSHSSCHLCVLKIDFGKLKTTRAKFMSNLKKKGISTQVHYIPVYRQPYYQKNFKVSSKKYPETENYYKRCLSIPLYPAMSNADVNRVIKVIKGMTK